MASRVAIIILNYNTSSLALRCARSFLEKCSGDFHHLMIVDNASHPHERRQLIEERPEGVELLLLRENRGYTGGNNQGVYHALRRYRPDYFLLINADAYVYDGGFLRALVDFMDHRKDAGFAGPLVYLRSPSQVQNTILSYPFLSTLLAHWVLFRLFPRLLPHSVRVSKPVRVPFLNGVCILIRREVFENVGFFRDAIFMYVEDADLQWRARQKGYYSYFVPVSGVVHDQNPDGYTLFSRVSRLLRVNTLRFLQTYASEVHAKAYTFFTSSLTFLRAFPFTDNQKVRFFTRLLRDFARLHAGLMVEG